MAVKIVLKRSSIPNKRPNADLLSPGELALNTNALTPGLFFETENNEVVKVGPVAVGEQYPTLTPSLGELSYNPINNSMSIGDLDPETLSKKWREIASPYLGGTNGYVVFVAPEFPTANDNILNDGQSAPFQTLNRAILEIAKLSIVKSNESDRYENNRYTILVQPGNNTVYNGTGIPVSTTDSEGKTFDVNFDTNPDITPEVLQEFNPETGGLIVPRGTSIRGVDLRKTTVRPTYVPTFESYGRGVNQPRTSIFKWTGNSYITDLTFKDKSSEASVTRFGTFKQSNTAVFFTAQAHGYQVNDKITYEWARSTSQISITGGQTILNGTYYVQPVTTTSFLMSYTPINGVDNNYVERGQLPANDQGLAFMATAMWRPYSHHRLSAIMPATLDEVNEFYIKVQKAFPTYFDNKVNQGEVINPGETEIVAPVDLQSLRSNQNENGSPYTDNCSVRSTYGLCGVDHPGDLFTGFRSALVSQFTCASIQNDPYVYEVYSTIFDEDTQTSTSAWYPLPVAAWAALPAAKRPDNPWLVTTAQQLEYLNGVPLVNIRYYYESLTSQDKKSYGITNFDKDCRHFGFRCNGNGYLQVDTGWTIGPAVGFWALNGGKVTVTNSSSNFGSISLRSEGFQGIGSLGGALPQDQGFTFAGIRLPQRINPYAVDYYNVYSLGATVQDVTTDPATGVQTMTLGPGFDPITLLPFSLAPNTAVWIDTANIQLRAFFIDDGKPTTIFLPNGECQLRLRAIDSSIPDASGEQVRNWEPPYIRRFQDQRTVSQQAYSLILQNTQAGHRDPQKGYILRLQQESSSNNQAATVRPGVQFDPASTGGWGRVFQVVYSQTSIDGDAPQFNETLLNRPFSSYYYTAISALDNSRPWVEAADRPHGAVVTYENRNWYATCNDQWQGVYFSPEGEAAPTNLKLPPSSYNSPWATGYCLENQYPVKDAYQGQYGGDPYQEVYKDGTYYRGNTFIAANYDFSDNFNQDNGTKNLGLLRHNVMTGISTVTTEDVSPEDTEIPLASLTQFLTLGDPKKDFVVLALTSANDPDRKEYVQVLQYNLIGSSAIVRRGVYGTTQTGDWPAGTVASFQATATEVEPEDYDKDWAPSKYAMIRFLEVMGFSQADIQSILKPRVPSDRNLYLNQIAIRPNNGYALNVGPWAFEFNQPSLLNATFHQFYNVGYFDYSRGLTQFLKSNLNTKQQYDFISTVIWGANLTMFGQTESGQTILEGDLTQAMTGRPYGSLSSDITDYPRYKVDTRDDGEVASYVRLVETGPGLVGGPITDVGSISLVPATDTSIGGVFPGDGLSITPAGELNLDRSTVGTVNSITAGIGLGAPNTGDVITNKGTIDLLPPTATTIGGVTAGTGVEISISGALGILPGTTSTIGGVKEGTGTTISASGALSILPPSEDGTTIGGVKAGKGILIDADGTISVPDGPSGVFLLDALTFDGTQVQFSLTSGGQPVVPAANQYTLIAVGGVIQSTPQAYSVTGNTITFTAAPPAGATFYGVVFG